MSQSKQNETLEHIFLSITSILRLLKDLRKERNRLIDEVNAELQPIIADPSKISILTIQTIVKAIEATPVKLKLRDNELMQVTEEFIDQAFLIKRQQDIPEHTEQIIRRWLKAYFKKLDLVLSDQDSRIPDYINRLFNILGSAFHSGIIDDEGETDEKEKAKDDKDKDKEKKAKKPKFVIGGGEKDADT